MDAQTEATLLALADAVQKAGVSVPDVLKAFTQPATATQGLQTYDLEAPSKKLFPVITPLRNMVPRVMGRGGNATNWKSITSINVNAVAAGVSEGNRGGVVSHTVVDKTAKYIGLGLEDYVTFEADLAGQNFEDLRSLAVENLLKRLMINEEQLIVGGNNSVAFGTPTAPTLTDMPASGGTLAFNTAYHARVVALSLYGYLRSQITNGVGVPMTLTKANADGTNDVFGGGSSKISNSATVTTSNDTLNTHSIRISWPAVTGAVAYAVFFGTDATTNCRLAAITTINSIQIAATVSAITPGSGYGATAPDFTTNNTDNSTETLVFDGLISIIAAGGSGAYVATQATGTPGTGTPLTSDNAGGIVEIDAAFKSFWDNYRLSPEMMLVNAQELQNITKKVIAGGSAPLFRFTLDGTMGPVGNVSITAGSIVGQYLNKFTMNGGSLVKVMLHPNVPPGMIIFYSNSLPYPLSNVTNVLQMKNRREYYQIEWPLRSRKYEYGVYVDEVLQCYFPPAYGFICNIANG